MTASTATTMASEARRLRLAGGRGSSGNNSSNNVVEVGKGKREAHNLSPAARRRLLRSQRAHSSEDESYADSSRGGGTGSATNNKHIRRSQGHRIESREDTQLSLHVAESSSLDSDDNGTCFNSVGTASRHPSPTKNRRRQQQHQQQNRRYRVDELTTLNESATSRDDSKSGRNNDRSSIWNQRQDMVSSSNSRHKASDDNTVYSDYDQTGRFHRRGGGGGMGGNASITGGGASSVASSLKTGEAGDDLDDAMLGFQSISPLKQVGQNVGGWTSDKDTNDKVDEVLSKPNVKTALGIAAAATVGAAIMGPVGVLVGAASIGIGIGVMQIPEEQRSNVASHASISLEKARSVALDVSENMGKSCAKFYDKETGKDNPDALGDANEIMDRCCSIGNEEQQEGTAGEGHVDLPPSPIASGGQHGVKGMVGDTFDDKNSPSHSMSEKRDNNLMPENVNTRAAACGRVGRVVPLAQIHSLRPSLQPRAWLDVMASAYTTRDDKNEAMQEILILAKDKDISRWFLEEGILDSLMLILSTYFRSYSSFLRNIQPQDTNEQFKSYKVGGPAFIHARLASNCCVALGKAHCAAVHTEGDMLLMSAYSRGSVPVQRQLAQMLFEVPHHMKVINPEPTDVDGQYDAEFTLTILSMQQAEDLASSIKALEDGKIDFE